MTYKEYLGVLDILMRRTRETMDRKESIHCIRKAYIEFAKSQPKHNARLKKEYKERL